MLIEFLKEKLGFNSNPVKVRIQQKLLAITKSLPNTELKYLFKLNCFLAGGAIRSLYLNEKVNDWDIFFKSEEACNKFVDLLDKHIPKSMFKFKSQHTYTIDVDGELVQFCLGNYSGDPDYVISRFDYTNSMAYYDINSSELNLTSQFTNACDNRILEFNENAYNPKIAAKRFNTFTESDGVAAASWSFEPSTPIKIVQSMGKKNDDDTSFG